MVVKDYYKILELPPQATEADVKKSFRRLALRYHPDTNINDRHADAWFREIQEAYEVLTNPVRKAQYLQQRWLVKSTGRAFAETAPVTPAFILKRFEALRRQVADLDHFRLDHEALSRQIGETLDEQSIEVLQREGSIADRTLVVQHTLEACEPLHYRLLPPLATQLRKLVVNDASLTREIDNWEKNRMRRAAWEKHQGWILALAAVALCWMIFRLAA